MESIHIVHWAPQSGTETGTGRAIDTWSQASSNTKIKISVVSQNKVSSSEGENPRFIGGKVHMSALRSIFRGALQTADAVHLHGAFDPTLSFILALAILEKIKRKILGKRLVIILTPHGALSNYVFSKKPVQKYLYWNIIDQWIFRALDGIVCNTPIERQEIEQRLRKINCHVVPLVIDSDPAVIGKYPENPNSHSVQILCTVGRYDIMIKGLDIIIEAVVALNLSGTQVKLRCIGYDRGGGVAALQKLVDDFDARDYVDCVGPKYGEEKNQLITESDIFCMPSRYESFSYSLMEGLASGLPVLVGSGACVTSYLSEEHKKWLVVEPAVEEWIKAIQNVLADRESNRNSAENAFAELQIKCSRGEVGGAMRSIYRNLILK